MRFFFLSSLLVFGVMNTCSPVQAQTSTGNNTAKEQPGQQVTTAKKKGHVKGTYINSTGKDRQTIIIHEGDRNLELETNGQVTVADDERSITGISANGNFHYTRVLKGDEHKIKITPGNNGQLQGQYWINNKEQDYATQGKAWLAQQLPELISLTGMGAEARAARLYQQGGAKQLLAHTAKMEGGLGRERMYRYLLEKEEVPAQDLAQMLHQLAGTKGSDYETSALLRKVPVAKLSNADLASAYVQTAAQVGSDYEKSKVLRHLLAQENLSDQVLTRTAEAIGSIFSDYEQRKVLDELAKRPQLNEKQFSLAMKSLKDISSDYERGKGLAAFMRHEQQVAQHFDQVVLLINGMGSDYERGKTFTGLLSNSKLGATQYITLLNASQKIGSDYEKAKLLRKMAPQLPRKNAQVKEAYVAAAKTVTSKYEYDKVVAAFE